MPTLWQSRETVDKRCPRLGPRLKEVEVNISLAAICSHDPGSREDHGKTSRELLMQIKEMAENMGYEVLHGIVDCLWVIGEPISVFKEAVERESGN